jgi:hypothetical protein
MVPNGSPEIFKFASSSGYMPPRLYIFAAGVLVEIAQCFVAEMIEDAVKSGSRLFWSRVSCSNVLSVNCDYVRDRDSSGVTVADTGRGFLVEVVAEGSFSFFSLARACSSAALDVPVSDDPNGLLDDSSICVSPCRL